MSVDIILANNAANRRTAILETAFQCSRMSRGASAQFHPNDDRIVTAVAKGVYATFSSVARRSSVVRDLRVTNPYVIGAGDTDCHERSH